MDQHARIAELKRRAQDVAGGTMINKGLDGLDPDLQERFWTGVVAIENASRRSLAQRLAEAGLEVPPADQLDGPALHQALRALIERLAEWRYFLQSTNHLGDRELYTLLREEVLVRPELELPPEAGYGVLFDLSRFDLGLPPGTIFAQYYADKKMRRALRRDWPRGTFPERRVPPCDRDRCLPAPQSGPLILRPPFVDDDEPAIVLH